MGMSARSKNILGWVVFIGLILGFNYLNNQYHWINATLIP